MRHEILAAVLICLPGPAFLRAQPTGLPGWIAAIEAADRSVLSPSAKPPDGLAAALRDRVPKMKDAARVVAAQALERVDTPDSAAVLLLLARDGNLSVASAATRALRNARNLPSGDELLRAIPTIPSPTLRAHLWQAAGKTNVALPTLRTALAGEKDKQAKQAALAAAVKRGGDVERTALAAEVRSARMEDVLPLMDLLVYTNEPRMGAALLPMFDSTEPVMRISPDPQSHMARRSDVAVWTAHRLGLIPELKLTSMQRFDAPTIAKARQACTRKN